MHRTSCDVGGDTSRSVSLILVHRTSFEVALGDNMCLRDPLFALQCPAIEQMEHVPRTSCEPRAAIHDPRAPNVCIRLQIKPDAMGHCRGIDGSSSAHRTLEGHRRLIIGHGQQPIGVIGHWRDIDGSSQGNGILLCLGCDHVVASAITSVMRPRHRYVIP